MLGVVLGWRWAQQPHGGTKEPAAAAQGVPPAPPPGWAPSAVHGGQGRVAPARVGSGTLKSPAQGGVGRRKASRQPAPAGRWGCPRSLGVWQCWGDRTGSLRWQAPLGPGGRDSKEQLFGLSRQSGCRADVNRRHAGRGKGRRPCCAKCGPLGVTRGFLGPRPGQAAGARCPGVNLPQVESHGPGPWHPLGSARPVCQVSGRGRGREPPLPRRYVNKGEEMSARGLEPGFGQGSGSRISPGGWGGGRWEVRRGEVKGGLSPRAQPAFRGSSRGLDLHGACQICG